MLGLHVMTQWRKEQLRRAVVSMRADRMLALNAQVMDPET